jgi:hypothetical protein
LLFHSKKSWPYWTALAVLCLVIGGGACAKKSLPDKFKEDLERFDQSILAFWEAGNMFKRGSGESRVIGTAQREAAYFALLEKGVALGDQVSDEFLDYLHPDLKRMYRDILLPGKRLYAEGARSGNRVIQTEGGRRVLEWEAFWEANKSVIAAKAYPDGQKPQGG